MINTKNLEAAGGAEPPNKGFAILHCLLLGYRWTSGSQEIGELIICHDDNLKRVFNVDLPVHEAVLAELKKATGSRIITLEEALQSLGSNAKKILVELKETGHEKKVLDEVNNAKLEDRVIIVSFHEEALAVVRKIDKKIEIGLIYTKFRKSHRNSHETSGRVSCPPLPLHPHQRYRKGP